MNDPWYQPRFVTCMAAIALMAAFAALNTWETDKGVYRVYLDEGEKLCAAYRGKARGWPQTFAVKYVLDEEATTLLGYPKRKFIDDEYDSRPLWVNLIVAFVAFLSITLVVESSARLVALRPKRVREQPRRTRFRLDAVEPPDRPDIVEKPAPAAVAAAAAGGRPITAKQGAKPTGRPLTAKVNAKPAGRPTSLKQRAKVEEPKARPISVKPALAARRQSDLRRTVKA